MAKEIVEKTWDDFEKANGREYEATLHVELSVVVKDLDGKVLPGKSLGAVEFDCNEANLDTVTSAVGHIYKLPTAVKSSRSGGGSSSPRRSGGGSKSTGGSRGGKTGEKAAFNSAVRAWAANDDRFKKISDKGRLPGEVTEAFQAAHPDWEQDYFPSRFGGEQRSQAPEQVDVEPEPAPENAAPPLPEGDDPADPPMEETNDEDWTRQAANTGVQQSELVTSYGP